jgi:hypothetical protein
MRGDCLCSRSLRMWPCREQLHALGRLAARSPVLSILAFWPLCVGVSGGGGLRAGVTAEGPKGVRHAPSAAKRVHIGTG